MSASHLSFNSNIGQIKRDETIENNPPCPFCDRGALDLILDEDSPILLVRNKYRVLENAFQTVLIETDECNSELSLYSKDHLHRLFRFAFKNWLHMASDSKYTSVIFFKNHGPYSGGTIRHPHMQIVGLNDYDYKQNIDPMHFIGIPIHQSKSIEFNISTHPRVGFFELNVLMNNIADIDDFADHVQIAAHFVLNHYNQHCSSYNIFFYEIGDSFAAKIMPRFVTSPLFVGYSIPQTSNRIPDIAEKLINIYY